MRLYVIDFRNDPDGRVAQLVDEDIPDALASVQNLGRELDPAITVPRHRLPLTMAKSCK